MKNKKNKTKTKTNIFRKTSAYFSDFFQHFVKGDWITRVSYFIMGFGCIMRHQVVRGFTYLGIQISFIVFMVTTGIKRIIGLRTLGTLIQGEIWDEAKQIYVYTKGDNSMLFLLFGVVSIAILFAFLCVYFASVRNAYQNAEIMKAGKRPYSIKEDWHRLFNENYHITILTPPLLMAFVFTVLPLIFMILIAFTNFDKNHQPPGNLFTWVGLTNFKAILWNDPIMSRTFSNLLVWTIIWAVFATFLNYIFGMILAMLINKKGIRLKKMWRTIFVLTIAVPQFVSLLLMNNLLNDVGPVNVILNSLGFGTVQFLTNPTIARITVIVVNLWVGVPYTMLITSGILMNIPEDLYESARIDGAGPIKQFTKITLPYMLFVTTPYLITQFIGNINNFNVIYLLTGGGPASLSYYQAGSTDLLVTWLYKLTVNTQDYSLASTIGIFIFIICAFFSLLVFNRTSSQKEEDTFQ